MLLKQVFKTAEDADKRAAFETAHCNGKYFFRARRCVAGEPGPQPFHRHRWSEYTWRIERTHRATRRGIWHLVR